MPDKTPCVNQRALAAESAAAAWEDVAKAADDDSAKWVRAFNRLEAAITHHKRATSNVLGDHEDADIALYKARDKILADLSAR